MYLDEISRSAGRIALVETVQCAPVLLYLPFQKATTPPMNACQQPSLEISDRRLLGVLVKIHLLIISVDTGTVLLSRNYCPWKERKYK